MANFEDFVLLAFLERSMDMEWESVRLPAWPPRARHMVRGFPRLIITVIFVGIVVLPYLPRWMVIPA